jgi:hypothetical protein
LRRVKRKWQKEEILRRVKRKLHKEEILRRAKVSDCETFRVEISSMKLSDLQAAKLKTRA